jgi:thiol-disulfide isomerase/thioredoxin
MFESLKTGNLVTYYKKILVIFLIISIFIAAAFYVYVTYIKKRAPQITGGHNENDSGSNVKPGDKNCELYFFYTDWCPHCKKAKPEWQNFKSMYSGGKKINGYSINFIEVDCEANPEIADKFKVEGYPTIKLIKGNQVIEFDAKPDVKTLEQFLSTVLSN